MADTVLREAAEAVVADHQFRRGLVSEQEWRSKMGAIGFAPMSRHDSTVYAMDALRAALDATARPDATVAPAGSEDELTEYLSRCRPGTTREEAMRDLGMVAPLPPSAPCCDDGPSVDALDGRCRLCGGLPPSAPSRDDSDAGNIQVKPPRPCPDCDGTGWSLGDPCAVCQGPSKGAALRHVYESEKRKAAPARPAADAVREARERFTKASCAWMKADRAAKAPPFVHLSQMEWGVLWWELNDAYDAYVARLAAEPRTVKASCPSCGATVEGDTHSCGAY